MSGKNVPLLNIPPGISRNSTRYATGNRWYDGNQIRWRNNVMVPIAGWVKILTFPTLTTAIRRMFSYRDDTRLPWLIAGSSDMLFATSYANNTYTVNDITPSSLGWNPGGIIGYGRDYYGSGYYGLDGDTASTALVGTWSLDNFGRLLTAVHSQDGRLVTWDPNTPTTHAVVVAEAPTGNMLVITTAEEHCMVLGGSGAPRRVKWSSRRDIHTWTAAENNSAGGFDLTTNGSILMAMKVQGGILVLTDTDVHLIEYVGPPNYYGRRKIADEGGVIGRGAGIPALGGAIWLDHSNIWSYQGGAVQKFPCEVQDEIFVNSNFSDPDRVHMGINEEAQEIWIMYPSKEVSEPDRYAALSYSQDKYWTIGSIPRTAWINPVWTTKPMACNGKDLYQHEIGMLDDGNTRVDQIFIESGALEISEGDENIHVDRIYHDSGADMPDEEGDIDAFRLSFILQQSPRAPKRLYGPIAMTNPKGYTTVRFRARQMYMRVDHTKDSFWKMGNIRMRIKTGGKR